MTGFDIFPFKWESGWKIRKAVMVNWVVEKIVCVNQILLLLKSSASLELEAHAFSPYLTSIFPLDTNDNILVVGLFLNLLIQDPLLACSTTIKLLTESCLYSLYSLFYMLTMERALIMCHFGEAD